MANYYLNLKNGKALNALANFSYNMGLNDYSYKEKEIVYTEHNMPEWVSSPKEFWEKYSLEDRANSSYKKIELSLQNELSLEENKKILNNFIEKNIGNNFCYSVVIHDKESSVNGIKNIHAHIMVCKRKLDGIERTPEQFFKRYNSKVPESGGALTDNNYWGKKSTLLNMRESWENIINNSFSEKKIDKKVSCKSLKKQKEEALERGDLIEAKKLDRPPISIDGYIFKKKGTLTEKEKEKLEYYKECLELKSLNELCFSLEKEKAGLDYAAKERDKNTGIIYDTFIEKKNIFSEIFDIQHSLFLTALEKEILKRKAEDNFLLKEEALRNLNKDYGELSLKIDTLLKEKNLEEILSLEKKQIEIENKINNIDLEKAKNLIIKKLNDTLRSLSFTEQNLFFKLENEMKYINFNKSIMENYYKEYQYKNWENNYTLVYQKRKQKNDILYQLKKIEHSLSTEQLNFSTYNSLSKGEYSKLTKELNGVEKKLNTLELNIKEKNRLLQKKSVLQSKINNIISEYKKGNGKNLFIRRKYSIKNNYYKKYLDFKESFEKINLQLEFLKNTTLEIPREKEKEFKKILSEKIINKELYLLLTEKQNLLFKLKNLESDLKESSLQKNILNLMTEGKYQNLIDKYSELLIKKTELESINKNSENLQEIKLKMDELNLEQKELISTIDTKVFSMLKDRSYSNTVEKINNIKNKLSIIEAKIEDKSKFKNSISCGFNGNFNKFNNFSSKNINAELGKVLYTGNIMMHEEDDKYERQMKKELDFSR